MFAFLPPFLKIFAHGSNKYLPSTYPYPAVWGATRTQWRLKADKVPPPVELYSMRKQDIDPNTDSWTRGQKTILGGGVLSCLQSHGQPLVDAGHDCWLEIWRVNKGLVVMWRIKQQKAKVGKSLLGYPMFDYFYLMSMKVIVQHTDHIFRLKSYFTHWLRCIAYSTSLPSLCLCFPTCQMGITAVPTLESENLMSY